MTWEDTLAARRGDGTRVFLREFAVPLRGPSGDIDGMVVLVSEAGRRDAQREPDRLRLLERISERLAGSLEFDTTLRQVAQILVPRFADHCFIDLFSGEKLIRRAAAHAGGWEPPPGTWAQIGEPISYPPGHFAEQAMSRRETIVVPDLQADFYPAPSEESMSAADQAGLTSVLASPLYARGELLGVISLALSRITDRPDPHYDLSDGDLIGAIAGRVAVALDNAMLFETERRTALAFQQSLLPQIGAGARRPRGRVPLRPRQAAGGGRAGHPDPGRRGLVRHHPAGGGPGGHGDRRRGGPRRPGGGHHGPAPGGAARLRAGREVARRHHAQAGRVGPLHRPARARRRPAHGQLHLPDLRRLVARADVRQRRPRRAADGRRTATVRPLEVRHKGVLLGVRGRGIGGLPTYREQTVTLPPAPRWCSTPTG